MIGLLAQTGADASAKLATPSVAWSALLPVLILIGGGMVLLVVSSLWRSALARRCYAPATALIAAAAGIAAAFEWQHVFPNHGAAKPFTTVAGAVGIDGFSLFATFVICAGAVLTALTFDGYLEREDLPGIEPYALTLFSSSGAVIMAMANDLMVMFLGLEILSIAVYVLAGLHTRRSRSGEASLKYFILGGFSSAFFLYGIALCYGATGSTNLAKMLDFLAANALSNELLLLAGIMLLLVGFAFKVAAVPFHTWTPDVYQGAPTPVTGFMASVVKVGGFVGLMRVFFLAFPTYRLDWQPIVYALAVLTLVVGAVMAVVQTDVKRLLAYSSISHAGFILVGVQAGTERGASAALFYLASYSAMVLGTFAIISVLGRRGDGHHSLDDYKGIAQRQPVLAFLLTIFLFAQAGVPLTAGFVGKFEVLMSAVEAHSYWLALVAMVSAVIAAYLYLKIIITMYAGDKDEDLAGEAGPHLPVPWGTAVSITLAALFVVGVGIVPGPVTNLAVHAVPHIIAAAP